MTINKMAIPAAFGPVRALLPLIMCMLLAHGAMTGARVVVSLAALSVGAPAFFVGLAVGSFGLFSLFGAVKIGRWVDRIGPARPMQIGFVLEAVGLTAALLGPHPLVLLPAALLIGAGICLAQVSMQTCVGLVTDASTRSKGFAHYSIGASVSSFAGPVIAGFAIDHGGYRVAFAVLAFMATLAFAWQYFLQKQAAYLFPVPAPRAVKAKTNLRDLLTDKSLLTLFLLSGSLACAWDTFNFVMPLHGKQIGLSASTIGLLLGTCASAVFLVRLSMPWLNQRFSNWQILRAVFLICLIAYSALPFIQSLPWLFAVAFFLGLGMGASQSNMLTLLHNAAPKDRAAEAVGIRTSFGTASAFGLPTTFGAVGAVVGFAGLFAFIAVLMSASSFVAHRRAQAKSI